MGGGEDFGNFKRPRPPLGAVCRATLSRRSPVRLLRPSFLVCSRWQAHSGPHTTTRSPALGLLGGGGWVGSGGVGDGGSHTTHTTHPPGLDPPPRLGFWPIKNFLWRLSCQLV